VAGTIVLSWHYPSFCLQELSKSTKNISRLDCSVSVGSAIMKRVAFNYHNRNFLTGLNSSRFSSFIPVNHVMHKTNICHYGPDIRQLSNYCISEMQRHIAQIDNAIVALATSSIIQGQYNI